jgi:HK97 gp10 family phage protein
MARLRSDLTRLAELAPKLAKEALLQTAADVFDVSQQLVPVDTGALKQSGGVDVIDSSTVRVGYGDESQVDYAKFVEYGTSKSAAQPFLTPAFAQAEETFKKRITEKMQELK